MDIDRCLQISAREGVPVPTKATIISVSDENEREIWDDLLHKTFVCKTGHGYQPVRYPQRLRYVHLDLAISGLAGIAICHLVDRAPTSMDDSFGLTSNRLIVEYDFILTISPGKTRPISLEKIYRFLTWLKNPCGFRFGLVTADSFQSAHILQRLHSDGIETSHQSVDRDKRAYLAWQAGFQEGSIRLYPQQQLLREVCDLIELDAKIDHLPNRTKDTTDAAAAAYLSAISSPEITQLNVPTAPPVVLGPSPKSNASPEDPFGFFTRLPPRASKVYHA